MIIKKKLMVLLAAILFVIAIAVYVIMPKPVNNVVTNGGTGIARTVRAKEVMLFIPDGIPKYKDGSPYGVDLRRADLRRLNLSGEINNLAHCDFDTNTLWPEQLPEGFAPDKLMELGKNPGLGMRNLHEKGIDGTGVSIAVIDQALLTGHEQYRDNLVHYEEYNLFKEDLNPQMHGAAVASLAVGKDTGVAPGADLYYLAVWHSNVFGQYDLTYYAEAIDRILEINRQLPSGKKIRVVSISNGWEAMEKGKNKMLAAIGRAKAENVFVITTALDTYYDFDFFGADRDPYGDPDDPAIYNVGRFLRNEAVAVQYNLSQTLYVPMDSRAYASYTGETAYEYTRIGGLSWSVPYLAGLYALACQVDEEMTPEKFWNAAMSTADTVKTEIDGNAFTLEHLVNPARLIESL